MSLSRRKTLAIFGGGTVLAASAGAGLAITQTPQKALKPWALAGGYAEPRLNALSFAVLAPNPHNRQPWMVDLSTDGQVTLYVDTNRLLPHTDPFSRQIVISLGCFLEVMRMAAAEKGYKVEFDLFPDGESAEALDQRPVAVARFERADVSSDPLFAHVFDRRSLKEIYDTNRLIASQDLAQAAAAARFGTTASTTNDADMIGTLRELTRAALVIELETPHTYKESVDLFRIGAREVDANPDGIDFSGPMWETLHMTGLFSREAALDTSSFSYAEGLKMVQANAVSGMSYLWLTTDGNTRADQIAAGRDWVRVNLALTALGLGTQPMSQALQEFPEMADLYDEVHKLLAPQGGTVQMLGRVGYGPDVPQSPRWMIEDKVISGA